MFFNGLLARVIRRMIERCNQTPEAFAEDDFETTFESLAGVQVQDLFAAYVDGAEPLPWQLWLAALGVDWRTDGPRVLPAEKLNLEQRLLRAKLFGMRRN